MILTKLGLCCALGGVKNYFIFIGIPSWTLVIKYVFAIYSQFSNEQKKIGDFDTHYFV